MKGKTMIIGFYSLGPSRSAFSIPCLQITDSFYVAHSENMLYRSGYDAFTSGAAIPYFFKLLHSGGELDARNTSKNLDKRRVYIDIVDDTVYSINTQYAGNTVGLKKLSMRMAIAHAAKENWLCEHMLLMGIKGPQGRTTYMAGAFPSLCGKTSTAMMEGETIVGDDIAYLRAINGEVRGVNVERGIFGIIPGVNSKDDPLIWKVLTTPREVIFSNILMTKSGGTHWVGRDGEIPREGVNHSGEWAPGKKDAAGKEIPVSHPNARFTISLDALDNLDPHSDDPAGVPVAAFVYGGRDSDTSCPVEEAFDWVHGIITKGVALESETTAATLGSEGVRAINPMSNIDFVSVPVGKYIEMNLAFGNMTKAQPRIFGVNYFLRSKEGKFLNGREDKRVWYKWIERRVHNEVKVLTTPVGSIPLFEDLQAIFKDVLGKDFTRADYERLFTLRIQENLKKIERAVAYYKDIEGTPAIFFSTLEEQKKRLLAAREQYKSDYISPFVLK